MKVDVAIPDLPRQVGQRRNAWASRRDDRSAVSAPASSNSPRRSASSAARLASPQRRRCRTSDRAASGGGWDARNERVSVHRLRPHAGPPRTHRPRRAAAACRRSRAPPGSGLSSDADHRAAQPLPGAAGSGSGRRHAAGPADHRRRAADLRDRHRAPHPAQRARAARAGRRAGRRHARARPAGAAARGRHHHRHHGERPGPRPSSNATARSCCPTSSSATPQHLAEHLPAHRLRGRPAHRRIQPDGGRAAAGRLARQHRVPAAGARRSLCLDPQVRQARRSTSPS